MKHLFYLLILVGFWGGCGKAEQEEKGIFCSAERVRKVEGRELFVQGDHFFGNGNTQSKEEARTGKFSCKVTVEQPYGFDYRIDTLVPGDKIIATVWKKGEGGALAIKNEAKYYKQTKEAVAVEGDWEQLQLEMQIDDYNYNQPYLLHCWLANKDQPTFFDDFKIQVVRAKKQKVVIPKDAPVLHIQLTEAAKQHITAKREEAIKMGLIVSGKDSKVQADINANGEKHKGTIRLKGDMLDHVRGKKWSFRIELEKGKTWQGMNEFSIQNPLTRSYLHEWHFHEMLRKEEILSPKYGFVFVVLNKDTLGLYAYEEHFTPELLTAQNREVAPVLKFDEDKMWEVRQQNNMQDVPDLPVYEAAEVKVYSGTRDKKYMRAAIANMRAYQYGYTNPKNIINSKKIGTYLAILDVCKAYHALIWHNQRWYYNPKNQKLEPIGYDGYTHNGAFDWIGSPFVGHEFYINDKLNNEEITRLLYDSTIYSHYMQALEKITAKDYISQFIQQTREKANKYEQWIGTEYPSYKYDRKFLLQNAKKIQQQLPPEKIDFAVFEKPAVEFENEMPFFPDVLFNASYDGKKLYIKSFLNEPIIIVGFGQVHNSITQKAWEPLEEYSKRKSLFTKAFFIDREFNYAFIKIVKSDMIVPIKIKEATLLDNIESEYY